MAKILKMKMPTMAEHSEVLALVDDAITYNVHVVKHRAKVKRLQAWRQKYAEAYVTATGR